MLDSNFKIRRYSGKPLEKLLTTLTLPKGTRVRFGEKILHVKSDAGPDEQAETRFELNEQGLQDPTQLREVFLVLRTGDRRLWGISQEQLVNGQEVEKLNYSPGELAEPAKLSPEFLAPSQTLREKLSAAKREGLSRVRNGARVNGKHPAPAAATPVREERVSAPPPASAPVTGKRRGRKPGALKKAAPKTRWVLDLARELSAEKKAEAFDALLGFMTEYSNEFVLSFCDPKRPLPAIEVVATSNQNLLRPEMQGGEIVIRGIVVQASVLKVRLADRELQFDFGSFVGHPKD